MLRRVYKQHRCNRALLRPMKRQKVMQQDCDIIELTDDEDDREDEERDGMKDMVDLTE